MASGRIAKYVVSLYVLALVLEMGWSKMRAFETIEQP